MTYYVYLIKTTKEFKNRSYVGFTNNIKNRLTKHNTNKGAKSTRGYQWRVVYKKKFVSKSKAMSYEYRLKNNNILRKKIIDQYD
tara:strand:+ start:1597 stop:1848 length:252 start_codon:yes stop_codon:yes gene_type:complete